MSTMTAGARPVAGLARSPGTRASQSGVFSARERAALELAESYVYIHEEGVSDELYDHVCSIFTEEEYVALSWLLVSIGAFNRITIAGKYPVPPRRGERAPSATS